MKTIKYIVSILIVSSLISSSISQNGEVKKQVKSGLTGLTSWGGASLLTGLGIGLSAKNDFDKNYGITHAAWGGINGAIGAIALATLNKSFEKKGYSNEASKQLEFSKSFQGVYLLNSVLDVGYIAFGYFTWKSGFNTQKFTAQQQTTRRAVGNASMVQSTGLLIYDLILYTCMRRNIRSLNSKGVSFNANANGVTLSYNW